MSTGPLHYLLEEFLDSGNSDLRVAGARSAPRLGQKELLGQVIDTFLAEADPEARQRIEEQILGLAPGDRDVAASMVAGALKSDNAEHRKRAYLLLGMLKRSGAHAETPNLALGTKLDLVRQALPTATGGTTLERAASLGVATGAAVAMMVVFALLFLWVEPEAKSGDLFALAMGSAVLIAAFTLVGVSYTRPIGMHPLRWVALVVESVRALPDLAIAGAVTALLVWDLDDSWGVPALYLCMGLVGAGVIVRYATGASYHAARGRRQNILFQLAVGTAAGFLSLTLLALPGAFRAVDLSSPWFLFLGMWPFALPAAASFAAAYARIDNHGAPITPARTHTRRRRTGVAGGALVALSIAILAASVLRAKSHSAVAVSEGTVPLVARVHELPTRLRVRLDSGGNISGWSFMDELDWRLHDSTGRVIAGDTVPAGSYEIRLHDIRNLEAPYSLAFVSRRMIRSAFSEVRPFGRRDRAVDVGFDRQPAGTVSAMRAVIDSTNLGLSLATSSDSARLADSLVALDPGPHFRVISASISDRARRLRREPPDAELERECWTGATSPWTPADSGYVYDCDIAVAGPHRLDALVGRGIMRARLGMRSKAFDDFAAFLAANRNGSRVSTNEVRRWVEQLRAGGSPFTPTLLDVLNAERCVDCVLRPNFFRRLR